MGVPGLWPFLHDSAEVTTLLQLALQSFSSKPDRSFRVGIDASIWDFHSRTLGKVAQSDPDQDVGGNAEVRMIMFRLLKLMASGCSPLIVFDGPGRPSWKRGNYISGSGRSAVERQVEALCNVLKIPCVRARGEAEAEMAAMNKRGVIDAVCSDDVDTLLFGASLVIRNSSEALSGNNGKISPNPPRPPAPTVDIVTYRTAALPFSTSDLIMIALLSGGDYIPEGIKGCGATFAQALARGGYGDRLMAAKTKDELDIWRESVCRELETDSQGFIGRKMKKLANTLRGSLNFPRPDVLHCYTNPAITSSSIAIRWDEEIDMSALIPYLEDTFEWSHIETTNKLRNLFWKGFFMKDLRRAALNRDKSLPKTPQLNSSYSSTKSSFASSSKLPSCSEHLSNNSKPPPSPSTYISTLHSPKTSSTTSFIPSYRVELNPSPYLAHSTPHLLSPDPYPPPVVDITAGEKLKNGTKEATGTTELRHWIPTELLMADNECRRLIEEFEEGKKKKSPVKKGRKVKDSDEEEEDGKKKKRKGKGKAKLKETKVIDSDEDEPKVKAVKPKKPSTLTTTAKGKEKTSSGRAKLISDTESSEEEGKEEKKETAKPTSSNQAKGKGIQFVLSLTDSDDDDELPTSTFPTATYKPTVNAPSSFSTSHPTFKPIASATTKIKLKNRLHVPITSSDEEKELPAILKFQSSKPTTSTAKKPTNRAPPSKKIVIDLSNSSPIVPPISPSKMRDKDVSSSVDEGPLPEQPKFGKKKLKEKERWEDADTVELDSD